MTHFENEQLGALWLSLYGQKQFFKISFCIIQAWNNVQEKKLRWNFFIIPLKPGINIVIEEALSIWVVCDDQSSGWSGTAGLVQCVIVCVGGAAVIFLCSHFNTSSSSWMSVSPLSHSLTAQNQRDTQLCTRFGHPSYKHLIMCHSSQEHRVLLKELSHFF